MEFVKPPREAYQVLIREHTYTHRYRRGNSDEIVEKQQLIWEILDIKFYGRTLNKDFAMIQNRREWGGRKDLYDAHWPAAGTREALLELAEEQIELHRDLCYEIAEETP